MGEAEVRRERAETPEDYALGYADGQREAQVEIARLRALVPQVCHGDDRDPVAEAVERVTRRRVSLLAPDDPEPSAGDAVEVSTGPVLRVLPMPGRPEGLPLPSYARPGDAGLDLVASEPVRIEPGQVARVRTHLQIAIPPGHVGLICDRSSIGGLGVKVMGGVIDAGYRGEIVVVLANVADLAPEDPQPIIREAGDAVAQLLVLPVARCEVVQVIDLEATERGVGGFGSTGR